MDNPSIPFTVEIDNHENFTEEIKLEIISKYIDNPEITVISEPTSYTIPPLSKTRNHSNLPDLFEGKWISQFHFASPNNSELYEKSFFLDIIPASKWISINAIPLTAVVSSLIAILAVYLQFRNSKDTQKNMKKQIGVLESEIELNKNRMIGELRPWINKRLDIGIGEHNISEELNKVTLYFSNFGRRPL